MEGSGGSVRDVREALPLGTRSRVAIAALGLTLVVDVFAFVADLKLYSIAGRLSDGERVPFSDVDSADDLIQATGIAQIVMILLTAIVFLLWFSRAYRNGIAMGIRIPRYGTKWAIGCWFVPFVNLVVPKNVSNDVWRGSDPEMAYGDPAFASRPVAGFVHWWWAFWIISGIVTRIATTSSYDARNADEVESTASLYMVADGLYVVAAVLAILFVSRTTSRSEERRRRFALDQASADPAAPPPRPAFGSPPPPPQ